VVGDGDGGGDIVEAVLTVACGDRGVTVTSNGRLVPVVVMTPKIQVRVRGLWRFVTDDYRGNRGGDGVTERRQLTERKWSGHQVRRWSPSHDRRKKWSPGDFAVSAFLKWAVHSAKPS
jgi:hypothetical protein